MKKNLVAALVTAFTTAALLSPISPAQAAVECTPTQAGRLANSMGAFTRSTDSACKSVAVRAYYSPAYTSGVTVWTAWKYDFTGYYAGVATTGSVQKSQHLSDK